MLDVGDLVGDPRRRATRIAGTRPTTCDRVIEQITADYTRVDPADAAYFASPASSTFETQTLAEYHALIQAIKAEVRRHADRRLGEHRLARWPMRSG